jgi:multidrug transporter EmrE-like cation transporter
MMKYFYRSILTTIAGIYASVLFLALSMAKITFEIAMAPVWFCIGTVRCATETMSGFAAKSQFRLLIYDR